MSDRTLFGDESESVVRFLACVAADPAREATAAAAPPVMRRPQSTVDFSHDARDAVSFAVADPGAWTEHTLTRGPRVGTVIWINKSTKARRNTPPTGGRAGATDASAAPTEGGAAPGTPAPASASARPDAGRSGVAVATLDAVEAALKTGVDVGGRARTAFDRFAAAAKPTDVAYAASRLGLDARTAVDTLRATLYARLSHPGEAGAEASGLRAGLAAAMDGSRPLDSRRAAEELLSAPPEQLEYLRRVFGLPPLRSDGEVKASIISACARAFRAAKSSPASLRVEQRIRVAQDGARRGDRPTLEEYHALRDDAYSLNLPEAMGVADRLGASTSVAYTRAEQLDDVVKLHGALDALAPPIAERLQAATESRRLVDRIAAQASAAGDVNRQFSQAREKLAEATARGRPATREQIDANVFLSDEVMRLKVASLHAGAADRRMLYEALKPAASIPWRVEGSVRMTRAATASLNAALDFFRNTAAAAATDDLTPVVLVRPHRTRSTVAYTSSGGVINLRVGPDGALPAVHELGHILEMSRPGLKKAAGDFLKMRIAGEHPRTFKSLYPGLAHGPRERGAKDNFDRFFTGVSAWYCGKIYSGGETEILSMGVEALYRDPVGFCAKDPEYAHFVIGVLRGEIR